MKTLPAFPYFFLLGFSFSVQAAPIPTERWVDFDRYTQNKTAQISQNHRLIQVRQAHARGYTGKGVVITIVDSGVDVNHPMFKDRLLPGWDTHTRGDANQFDADGHGTHVAGIAGGGILPGYEKYKGVAYQATILPVGLDFRGSTDSKTAKMIEFSASLGSVASNNSWGYVETIKDDATGKTTGYYSLPIAEFTRDDLLAEKPLEMQAYINTAQQGHVFVFAAGNHRRGDAYKAEPGLMAALPERFPELKGHWIAVVNVDMAGNIADSSHYCGGSAEWCIAAPGSDINSAEAGGTLVELTGTSMAAPHVTGGVAVVTGAFPNLSGDKVVNRLFVTANNRGIYADSKIYGHGLMNLNQATLPIGNLMLPTGVDAGQARYAFSDQQYYAGQLLRLSGFENVTVAMVDDYDGARFLLPASTVLQQGFKQTAQLTDALIQKKFAVNTAHVGDARRQFNLQYHQDHPGEVKNARWQWQQQVSGAGQIAVNFHTPYAWLPKAAPEAMINTLWQHPYLQLTGQGYQVRYQGASSYAPTIMASVGKSELDSDRDQGIKQHQNYGMLYKQPVIVNERMSFQAVAGTVVEDHSVLGSYASEAFHPAVQTPTYYTGVEGSMAVTEHWNWLAGFYQGNTRTDHRQVGLIRNVCDIKTQSLHTGLVYNQADAQAGFLLRRPLQVTSGQVKVHLPVDVDGDQKVQYQDYTVNLQAKRETEYTWFYKAPLKKQWDLTLVTQYQDHPQVHPMLTHNASGMLYLTRSL